MLNATHTDFPAAATAGAVVKPSPQPARVLDSRSLFDTASEVRIVHDGQEYRLRLTRNNKLLLTK